MYSIRYVRAVSRAFSLSKTVFALHEQAAASVEEEKKRACNRYGYLLSRFTSPNIDIQMFIKFIGQR